MNMIRLWACLLIAVTVRGTLASAGNGIANDHSHVKDNSSVSINTRVVGGQNITNAMLGGYIVALYYINKFVCGGTLLQDRIVLSAAHCFIDRVKKDEWVVIGGISSLNETGERRNLTDVVISPDFRPEDMNSDYAVILLKEPLVGKDISNVSLCTTTLKDGMQLVVSGWGVTKEGGLQDIYLRSATVPFIDLNKCKEDFRETSDESIYFILQIVDLLPFPAVAITNSMLCASALGKRDACIYDSGGPLVYHNQICGIVSFGTGCASSKYPGVYTDISYVKPFITRSINILMAKR
ncbi:hypothetical protein KR032_002625, partial [Drosophila birchii]